MKNKRIVIGMSGGVDSSVSAYLLKRDGWTVIGATLKLSQGQKQEDIDDARKISEKLGIEHHVLDCSEEFSKEVIDYFTNEYSRRRTPSPCNICNERIKYKKLIEFADRMGCDFISTGHYCDIVENEEFGITIKMSKDLKKDQSYMLYRIEKEWLNRIIYPLKNIDKGDVREIAKEIGLVVHDKSDSQGVCFAPEGYKEYLQKALKKEIHRGNFVDRSGKVLGEHEGYQLYTMGQRRGLGLTLPRAYFIVEIRPNENELVLGEYEELFTQKTELEEWKFFCDIEIIVGVKIIGRPRFPSKGSPGKVIVEGDRVYFIYDEMNPQNAPGQHIVFYKDDYLLGGGIIKSIKR